MVTLNRTNDFNMHVHSAGLFNTLESIATPCSVNAKTLGACFNVEHITICDMFRISSVLSTFRLLILDRAR